MSNDKSLLESRILWTKINKQRQRAKDKSLNVVGVVLTVNVLVSNLRESYSWRLIFEQSIAVMIYAECQQLAYMCH